MALEVLGAAAFPGPAPHAVAAAALLDGDAWAEVSTGDKIVTFGAAPVIAWAGEADIVLMVDGERVRRCAGPFVAVQTLGQSGCGRAAG